MEETLHRYTLVNKFAISNPLAPPDLILCEPGHTARAIRHEIDFEQFLVTVSVNVKPGGAGVKNLQASCTTLEKSSAQSGARFFPSTVVPDASFLLL